MKLKKLFNRKKNHRREPRANAFVLESLEPRLLLSATPMTAAVVTTDHLDYAPGETAVITTANTHGDGLQFGAGEFVRFQVTRTDGMTDAAGTTADVGPTGNEAWYVADGVGGFRTHLGADVSGDGVADWIAPDNDLTVNSSISTTWFVEEQYRNSSLLVTAAGQKSGAVASQAFTDAAENTTTTITSSGGPSVEFPGSFESTYGDAVTFTATVTAAVGANGRPTGTVEFYNGVTLIGTDTTASIVSPTQSSFSLTISTLDASDFLEGTNAEISAKYLSNNTGDTGWNDSTSGTIDQIVNQRVITGWLTVADKVYDGTTAATETGRGLNGVLARDIGNVVLTNGPDDNSVDPNGGPARFQSPNVDTNVAVFLWHVALTGTAAHNYHLEDYNIGTTANIIAPGAPVVENTTTTITSSTATSTYGDVVTFTATVTAAVGANGRPTGAVEFYDGVTLLGTTTSDTVVSATQSSFSLTISTLTAGSHASISAKYLSSNTGSTGWKDSTSGTIAQTVSQRGITGSFTAANKVYDGTTAASALSRTLTGVIGTDDVGLVGGTATFDTANAGLGKIVTLTGGVLTGAAAGNYSLTSVNTTTADITKADATVSVSGYTGVYDAAVHGATGSATGVGGVDLGAGLNLGTSFTNAPGGTANWTFSGGANYNDANGSVAILITKADAAVSVNGYTGVYDGAAHGATGSATGVGGEDLGARLNLGTSFTNVPGGTANWTFSGGTNYNNANGSVAIVITKADAAVSVLGYTGTYDGAAHGATGSATGVGGVDLSAGLNLGGNFTNAPGGTANWTFSGGTNYTDQSGSVAIVIKKANAVLTLTGYYGTYDAAAHQATGTATGVLGEDLSAGLNLSVTSHSNAGVYIDTVTFTDGTGNYKDTIKNVKSTINKANATLVLTGYYGTYDGAAHQATGTATGVLGEDLSGGLNLSVTSHSNAGVYIDTVTFTDGTGNYKDTIKNVKSTINKANAVISVTGYSVTFDGLAHTATGTATGVLGEDLSAGLDLSSTTHTNVGTYLNVVTFTDVTGNYKFTVKNVSSRIL